MAKVRYPHVNAANKYARDVVAGRISACLYVRQACQRHLDDLKKEKQANYPYRFDRAKGEKICQFAELMVHTKGKWAGQPIRLEPWQKFALAVPFGWVRKSDGLRRFREIYDEIPRKNGKSVLGAIIGLYMGFAEGEPGAEVYSAATSEKQAYEVFRPAYMMIYKNPGFRNRFNIDLGGTIKNPGNIYSLESDSRFETEIGKPGDGASPHCWLQDEYHEAKTDVAYDTGKTGMGARMQPMMVVITTGGTNTACPCYLKRKQAIKVLAGEIVNDELFVLIYTIDDEDGWQDFEQWRAANPNIGVSVMEDFLRSQHRTAIQESKKRNTLKCKHLNLWSNAGEVFFDMVAFDNAADPTMLLSDFGGRPVWMGLDLAAKKDLCALMLLFKEGELYSLFSRYYLPEDRTKGEDMEHYAGWAHDGYIQTNPGRRIDYSIIREDIEQFAKDFDVDPPIDNPGYKENSGKGAVCNDPWNAQQLVSELELKKIGVTEISQTVQSLSEPMKELDAVICSGKFRHDGNPVTQWCFANTMARIDKNDNVFPFKEGEENKIDGAAAAINAMCQAMVVDVEEACSGNDGSLLNLDDWDDW